MNNYKIKLEFKEIEESYMLDVTSLFYDLELLHDLSVLTVEKEYKDYNFTQSFWYRKGRAIKKYHKLKIGKIKKESPLVIEIIIPSLGAVWIFLQIIEKIQNWDLNREKLELEVKKLNREEEEHKLKMIDLYGIQLNRYLEDKGAIDFKEKIVKKLSDNPHSLRNIEIMSDEKEIKNKSQDDETNND